jgi:thiol-disulfide isomerase/thioredoxin
MKKIFYIMSMALLCLLNMAYAQIPEATLATLKIGDRIPDDTINNIINYSSNSLKLSDFKGKLLILDFWATWCTSCLKHFPTADSLQREFKDNIQILLVNAANTKDAKEKILKTLQRFNRPGGEKFNLPSANGDTILDRLFPHYFIPHYVWIDQKGFVRSITSSEELTRENIKNFLKEGKTPAYQKDDFDPHRPLYTVKSLPTDHLQQFSMLLKGKIDGISNGGMRYINDTIRGLILHNRSLLSMYQRITSGKIPGISENRLLLEVKDKSKLTYITSKEKMADWERQNFYSYELIVPANQIDHLYDYVLDDLNKYTPFQARIEKRKLSCWILEKNSEPDLLHSTGGESVDALGDTSNSRLINTSIFSLCIYLNMISGDAIIVDKTGYTQNIDLVFNRPVSDMATMKKLLTRYGLRLYSTAEDVDMLVVKDK